MKNVLLMVCFILLSNYSYGCSCIGKSSTKIAIKETDVVITGKILSQEIIVFKDEHNPTFEIRQAQYKVLVATRHKGKIKNDTLTIFTGIGNGDCGIKFQIGDVYHIYANYHTEHINGNKAERFLHTNICTKTNRYDEIEFNKIKKYSKNKRQ